MPRSELATTFQPLLSSTFDDPANGFHSILASSPHGNDKTKYIAAGSGLSILSSYEHIALSLSPFANFLLSAGHGQLSNSSLLTAQSTTTWGSSFAAVTQFESAHVGINQASTSFAEIQIPPFADSVFLHMLKWTDGGSCDVFFEELER